MMKWEIAIYNKLYVQVEKLRCINEKRIIRLLEDEKTWII